MDIFGREQIAELIATLRANKLRTVLTGFAVGWGVFLLVILLSSGMGLSNGIRSGISRMGLAKSDATLETGYVSIPINGHTKWKDVRLTRTVLDQLVKANSDDIKLAVPSKRFYGIGITAGGIGDIRTIKAIEPEYALLSQFKYLTPSSRFINEHDSRECRKVIVISEDVAKGIYGDAQTAMNRTLFVSSIAFKVIGVYKIQSGAFGVCYIPLSTAELLRFGATEGYDPSYIDVVEMLCPNIRTQEDCDRLLGKLRRQMSLLIGTDPNDTNTLYLSSARLGSEMMDSVIIGIDAFLWLIGLSTLFIGLTGVVMIMQVTITERKREIGIRKAIGAKPSNIIMMVLSESVFVTTISGLLGLMSGVGIMAIVNQLIECSPSRNEDSNFASIQDIIIQPLISLDMAVATLVIMVLGGLVAGYLPARRALSIPVVEAMRH